MCVCVFVPRERKSEGNFLNVIRRIMDGNGIGLGRTVIIFRMVALMVKEKECIGLGGRRHEVEETRHWKGRLLMKPGWSLLDLNGRFMEASKP